MPLGILFERFSMDPDLELNEFLWRDNETGG